MSPLSLRRFRAERMLREEFAAWRVSVLATVRRRLRSDGVQLDAADLEACYAQAWAGLYRELLGGREVANPIGWLSVVTYRRAIDEHRSRARERLAGMFDAGTPDPQPRRRDPRAATATMVTMLAAERDLAAELDDRADLRHVFEAFRGRLNERECEAASLCYLQGLPRAEAAARMGIGERAMRKLMEGRGPGKPGVAGKVGELLGSLRGGGWCEQQTSLMRAFAFGVLDPDGERYQLALAHRRECPACRRYVLSLRGLAAVLPPLGLPWGLGVGVGAGAGGGTGVGSGAGAGGGTGVGSGAGAGGVAGTGGGASAGTGVGGVGAGAGGGAGAGAGTGLGLGGGVGGAKLAVGCVLVLGVGCGTIAALPHRSGSDAGTRRPHRGALVAGAASGGTLGVAGVARGQVATRRSARAPARARRIASTDVAQAGGGSRLAASERAQREFGPERETRSRSVVAAAGSAAGAHTASTGPSPNGGGGPSRAEREFGP